MASSSAGAANPLGGGGGASKKPSASSAEKNRAANPLGSTSKSTSKPVDAVSKGAAAAAASSKQADAGALAAKAAIVSAAVSASSQQPALTEAQRLKSATNIQRVLRGAGSRRRSSIMREGLLLLSLASKEEGERADGPSSQCKEQESNDGAKDSKLEQSALEIQRIMRGTSGRRKSVQLRGASLPLGGVGGGGEGIAAASDDAGGLEVTDGLAAAEHQLLEAATNIQRLMRGAGGRRRSVELRSGHGLSDADRRKAAEDQRMVEARAKLALEKQRKGVPQTNTTPGTSSRFMDFEAAAANAPQVKRRSHEEKRDADAKNKEVEEEEVHEWTAAQWLQSLALHKVLARALNLPETKRQFNYVRTLTRANIEQCLQDSRVIQELSTALVEGVEKLQGSSSQQDGVAMSDKFQTNAKFQMSYGSLSLFYGGLESLLGPPKMVSGSLFLSSARAATPFP